MAIQGGGVSKYHRAIAGARWERVRRHVLNSANWQCAECGRYANQLDHIVPLSKGGAPWALTNLQPLCKEHHRRKTQGEKSKTYTGAQGMAGNTSRKCLNDIINRDLPNHNMRFINNDGIAAPTG